MLARGAAFAIVVRTFALLTAEGSVALADTSAQKEGPTRYELSFHGETHAQLFRRRLLPGENGALLSTATLVPLRQYVLVRARDLDADASHGVFDFELAAWSSVWLGDSDPERAAAGDVQTANVGYRRGVVSLRLGRQQVAGGAARYSHFDGLQIAAELGHGLEAEGYVGFTVLPRWDAQPGYAYLGAAVDSRLRNPEALPTPERSSRWLAGAKFGFRSRDVTTRLSFHEQREERGLVRRNLGADGRAAISEDASLGANALLELDGLRLADARLFGAWTPRRELDLSLEYLHTEPALLLSRQSVLSVFSADAFDEVGAVSSARMTRAFALEAAGFVQVYGSGETGARGELAARLAFDASRRGFARIAYARVRAPDNGYHSVRASLARPLLMAFSGTLEAYAYFYDAAIRGRRVSSVYAGTLTYQSSRALRALLGASLAQSPYARFDAQTQVALAYDFDLVAHRGGP